MDAANHHFVYIWEFEIIPHKQAEFLRPTGLQAPGKLFKRASGYRGTLLLNGPGQSATLPDDRSLAKR
jgi:hypothetical protein